MIPWVRSGKVNQGIDLWDIGGFGNGCQVKS
jgi:hypothetical protein